MKRRPSLYVQVQSERDSILVLRTPTRLLRSPDDGSSSHWLWPTVVEEALEPAGQADIE